MTSLTWLFFGMALVIGFMLGRFTERKTNKKLMKHVRELIEEARKQDERTKTSGL